MSLLLVLALTGCAAEDSAKETGDSVTEPLDRDDDGYSGDEDCDDDDASVHVGADETCNEVDDDCDGEVDEEPVDGGTWYVDADGDGYGGEESVVACEVGSGLSDVGGDCDDADAAFHPGADESDCADLQDYDCDGAVGGPDADGDSFALCFDCDDADAAIHPDATEVCDGADNDCDGEVDPDASADATPWYQDEDDDGYGVDEVSTTACAQPEGYAAEAGDCDDADAAYNPGARESDCTDPNDYNCDGSVSYEDADGDGVPACEECDDGSPEIFPGAEEVCDGLDNDCDGVTDPDGSAGGSVWYLDADADGFGDASTSVDACVQPEGWVAVADDCDDADPGANPSAEETCDGVDNDCDGAVDDGTAEAAIWYADADGDGYGDASQSVAACAQPEGWVEDATDCDDADALVHPAAAELCDGVDNDCDSDTDEDEATDARSWYADKDGDGFGDASDSHAACTVPEGYVGDDQDCDDLDASSNPDGTEVCGGGDEDCDGETDEDSAADASTWYLDRDGDGYGGTGSTVACTLPDGYAALADDCDDTDADYNPGATEADCADPNDYNCDGSVGYADADGDGWAACEDCNDAVAVINPGAAEICDAADTDEDCDGAADDADTSAVGLNDWYLDADDDGYGAGGAAEYCDAPDGYVAIDGDCDDAVAAVNPAAPEVCDEADTDEDCDGSADDADASVSAATRASFYADGDGDGYGDADEEVSACDAPADHVADDADCDDGDAAISPAAAEVCDAANTDEDCDGVADDADGSASGKSTWYRDADDDGYAGSSTTAACDEPTGYDASSSDCDDGDAAINPGATEVCDAADTDEDCDGSADDADSAASGKSTVYADDDDDGYGGTDSLSVCDLPDGYVTVGGDCDDGAAAVNPSATEACDAADTDEDCDGAADDADSAASGKSTVWADDDDDGYGAGAAASWCDVPEGWTGNDDDCDDGDAAINPAAAEICDAADTDEDCDGAADDGDPSATGKSTAWLDDDGDGYGAGSPATVCDVPADHVANDDDCNDAVAAINPAATEVCDAADTDEDCDGAADDADSAASGKSTVWADDDGDGYGAGASLTVCNVPVEHVGNDDDCDDADAAINPDAVEVCDAADTDEDCDGAADDASATGQVDWYLDEDADDWGGDSVVHACDAPADHVAVGGDCDDTRDDVNPDGTEVCDPDDADEDCDGAAEEDDADAVGVSTWYPDDDADGYGPTASAELYCDAPEGWTDSAGDCDDSRDDVSPDGLEVCDPDDADEDCDGAVDDADDSVSGQGWYYGDDDGDGYGSGELLARCDGGAGWAEVDGDCDEALASVNPGATEVCDEIDNDCDDLVDLDDDGIDDAFYVWLDADGDGYGDPALSDYVCEAGADQVGNGADCDDSDGEIHPGATELCDELDTDEDCDGAADDLDDAADGKTDYYVDADGDGYGGGTLEPACDPGEGVSESSDDCDDGDAAVSPGADEVCGGGDEDCDGLVDDEDASVVDATEWFADYDGDGFGSDSAGTACSQPEGTVADGGDCDDADDGVHPGAEEVCEDGLDMDCSLECRDHGVGFSTSADADFPGLALGSATAPGFLGSTMAAGWYDITGDALPDLVLGDYLYDTSSASDNKGRAYVIRGASGGVTDTTASPWATLTGSASGDRMAGSLGFVRDVDGDGDDELAVGAWATNPSAGTDAGSAYLFKAPVSGTLTPSSAFLTINGAAGLEYVGSQVTDGGDLDDDGVNDWIVAGYSPTSSSARLGRVAVVPGDLASGTYAINSASMLATLAGGSAGDMLGAAILGDVDTTGDGLPELYVASAALATIYVYEAPLSGTLSMGGADSSLTGAAIYADSSGAVGCTRCMVSPGDYDGDGHEDLWLGLDGWDDGGASTANYGGAFLLAGDLALPSGDIAGQALVSIEGYATSDYLGRGVGSGDIDDDGNPDLMAGAPGFDSLASGAGGAALLYGPATGAFSIATGFTGLEGVAWSGVGAGEALGSTVAGAADLDDDGYEDWAAGAPGWASGSTKYGKTFLWYGTGE